MSAEPDFFHDRCVVMVGMPYPNPTDPELCERMAFMDAMAAANDAAAAPAGSGSKGTVSPGQQYYQDLCMKVPQHGPLTPAQACVCMGSWR